MRVAMILALAAAAGCATTPTEVVGHWDAAQPAIEGAFGSAHELCKQAPKLDAETCDEHQAAVDAELERLGEVLVELARLAASGEKLVELAGGDQ